MNQTPDLAAITFVDAFKVNNAPYEIMQSEYGESKVYSSEAYTEDYMFRSVKSNRLCRYGVRTAAGIVAAYSYYGIRGGKTLKDIFFKMVPKMSKAELYAFIRSVYEARFTNSNDAANWVSKHHSAYNPNEFGCLLRYERIGDVMDALVVDGNGNYKNNA